MIANTLGSALQTLNLLAMASVTSSPAFMTSLVAVGVKQYRT